MVIGRQHAGASRQTMVPSQALRNPGDPAHNSGQGEEAINKESTGCASTNTATMMARYNTRNLTVSQKMTRETRCFATLAISLRNGAQERDATLNVKVDAGAQENILPVQTFKRMYLKLLDESGGPSKRHLLHRPTIMTAYNGAAMTHHGTIVIPCSYGNQQCDTEFYVVDTQGPVILALPTSGITRLISSY